MNAYPGFSQTACNCCSCRFTHHQAAPTVLGARPTWKSAIKRLLHFDLRDCCVPPDPKQASDRCSEFLLPEAPIKKNEALDFNNSATTCDLTGYGSYDEASLAEGRGWDLPENAWARSQPTSPRRSFREARKSSTPHASPSRVMKPVHHGRSKTSASPLPKATKSHANRARLYSNGNMSSVSYNSLHQRSSIDLLPSLDKIIGDQAAIPSKKPINGAPIPTVHFAKRPSLIRARGLSTGSQMTQLSALSQLTLDLDETTSNEEELQTQKGEKHSKAKKDDEDLLWMELSVSDDELGSKAQQQKSPENSSSAMIPHSPNKILPFRNSKLNTSKDWSKEWKENKISFPANEVTPVVMPSDEDNKKQDKGGMNDYQFDPSSYLPTIPVPQSASVCSVASVFTVGWVAVFWRLPSECMNKSGAYPVPKVTIENLYFVQLLSGGVLQLTPPMEQTTRKTILVMPKCKHVQDEGRNWKVELVSCRAGYSLAVNIEASTGSSGQQKELYLLPVHLPLSSRNLITTNQGSKSNIPEHMLFSPFRNAAQGGKSAADRCHSSPLALFAPNHQHESTLHLRFAMEAALTADVTLRHASPPK